MSKAQRAWIREESILAFNLYCKIPFGQISQRNPTIIELSKRLDRTPSSLSMKMGNFARLDPTHQKRNVKGLSHGSKLDKDIWEEFNENWEKLAYQSELLLEKLDMPREDTAEEEISKREKTETTRQVRTRLIQSFFRSTVLSGYHFSCAICKINLPMLLNASHIIPWSVNKALRADPKNGISLCALHDRAFDRGLISFDENYKTIISKQVLLKKPSEMHRISLIDIQGRKIQLPERFKPDIKALEYHRNHIFNS